MINRVDKFLDEYIKAGSDIITFHYEIDEDIKKIISKIKNKGIKCGLAIKPRTSWSEILPYLDLIDQVTIMTVEPGFSGQKFMNNQVDKIKNISNHISIELRNFGMFKSKFMEARYGSDPRNKKKIYIPSKWKVTFKASENINKNLNEKT